MPKNKMTDLRNHLFETLEALKDDEKPMDLDRAKTISLNAQTIINSATVEVKFLNTTGAREVGAFFDDPAPRLDAPSPVTITARKQGA